VSADDLATLMRTALSIRAKDMSAKVRKMVTALIGAGASCSCGSSAHHGCTPLYVACGREKMDMVKLLLQSGTGVVCMTKPWDGFRAGSTVLMVAAVRKSLDLFNVVLTQMTPEQVNLGNDVGETAPHLAVRNPDLREQRINLLLSAGALIDARTADGYTPLLYACRCQCSSALVQQLRAAAPTCMTRPRTA
jgi:ankyrin repeat protein